MKESTRTSRMVELHVYDHTATKSDFLEVTEWSNGEGFDLHMSRGEQSICFTWGEFAAMQAALGDWIDDNIPGADEKECPHVITTAEGTSYCKLAEKTSELLNLLRQD